MAIQILNFILPLLVKLINTLQHKNPYNYRYEVIEVIAAIELLIQNIANINEQCNDIKGYSALHFLVETFYCRETIDFSRNDVIKLIKIFKKYNANFNLTDYAGNTPLFNFVNNIKNNEDSEIAIELIKSGADYNIKNFSGKSAKDKAFENYYEIINSEYNLRHYKNWIPWKLLNFFHYQDELTKKIDEKLTRILPNELHSIIKDYVANDMNIYHNHYNRENFSNDDCCIIN